jgi:YtxH-like protein
MNKTLLAILLGIGIGVLIAPAKGSETINRLSDAFDDLKGKAQDKAEDLFDDAESAIKNGRSRAESLERM